MNIPTVAPNPNITRARALITSLKSGAFSPLSAHPVVRSLLVPFGGWGALQLADLLKNFIN